ncbi:2Fe-2S iron-sulfur cluster-binding protein [Streptomyces sp. 549]|uniref:2Fe-2S iron-sulfur cluster-binding protein n=1 Tax=Streptomyces sp. 549 TaxID=3049076 RepID=UPI0024C2DABA|nr:2Fe-2S iron-sulfur cluster-binding protein [Streptomyces sp. 549]MDK1473811.1 2Fe-2S iron-sulfur cluster-binding protein [Streptomyces sp. 549]
MSNDQQPSPSTPPTGGWGGEYDGDSTAFIQLPGPDSADGETPLAAPGTGAGWAPPTLGPPMTAAASLDPASTGHWTLPFADAAPADPEPPAPTTPAAAMGQGAAAALAGSHEARVQPAPGAQWQDHHTPPAGSDRAADHGFAGHGEAAGQWPSPADRHGVDDSGEFPVPPGRGEPEHHGPYSADGPHPSADGPPERPGHDADPAEGPSRSGSLADDGPEDGDFDAEPDGALDGRPSEHPHASYVLHVNGADRPVTDAWIGESLLYVLRERLGLAGAKDGCSQGECGACSVQVDGRLVASCLVPGATAAGAEIRTVEGLGAPGAPSDVQRALAARGGAQCGFCVPGMAMTVHDLLEGNHAPTELETRKALCGNLCRCSGYRGVLEAVREVTAERAAAAQRAAAEAAEAHGEHGGPHIPQQPGPGDEGGVQ